MILWEPTFVEEVAPPPVIINRPVVVKTGPVDWIEEECTRG